MFGFEKIWIFMLKSKQINHKAGCVQWHTLTDTNTRTQVHTHTHIKTAVLLCCLIKAWDVIAGSRPIEMICDPDGHWSNQTGCSQHHHGLVVHTLMHTEAHTTQGVVETLDCAVISLWVCIYTPPGWIWDQLSNEQISWECEWFWHTGEFTWQNM